MGVGMDDKYTKMIEDIHEALVGNDYNDEGLIKKVCKIENKVNQHDTLFKIGAGIIAFLTGVAAFWNDIKSAF